MAENNAYRATFDNFHRYHSGAMSAKEQHLFEKQMLEDTAFAEAFEGFLAMQVDELDTAQVNVKLNENLEARIAGRSESIVPAWIYGVAATLIITFGAIWIVLVSDPKQDVRPEASQKLADAPAPSGPPQEEVPSAQKPAPTMPAKSNIKPPEVISVPAQEPELAAAPPQENLAEEESSTVGAFADSQSRRNDVVLSEAATTRQSFAAPLTQRPAAISLMPQPLMGWESYNAYLEQNTDSAAITGDVHVSFLVNADATLSDFSAKGPKELQKEAIRIVRQGPLWVPVKRDGVPLTLTVSVTLHFKQ
ncbi:energy transducer TonB [Dyadobacter sp. CY326]|uniref:energy transducer TonB n=1 Tax=Dyadobacter sp. CY326 TaxID=2907300 RepID=UPI001F3A140C|nr:energy transducer TonB [Dyadobacter sp. CY326]MCE7066081.1 energy transducer TonB [Dyadobacter sp. CY326]